MGVRKPKTLPELVKITGMDEKYLEELLNKMAFNGVIEYNWGESKARETVCASYVCSGKCGICQYE